MINHISRQSAGVPRTSSGMVATRRTPTCSSRSTRSGPTDEPPAADVARIFLRKPDGAVLDRHDRGHGTPGADLDLVRDGRLVRADRPRRHVVGHPRPDHSMAAPVRGARRSDRAARRRRLRDQETRHDLLHGRARDLRVPRLGDRRRRDVRTGHPARGPRQLCHPRTAVGTRLLDLRLRPARPAAPCVRDGRDRPAGRPSPTVTEPAVHEPRLS